MKIDHSSLRFRFLIFKCQSSIYDYGYERKKTFPSDQLNDDNDDEEKVFQKTDMNLSFVMFHHLFVLKNVFQNQRGLFSQKKQFHSNSFIFILFFSFSHFFFGMNYRIGQDIQADRPTNQ